MSQIPPALATLDLGTLVGCTIDEARDRVVSAGGQLRVVQPGQAIRADLRPNRVTVHVVDGRITRVGGIG